MKKNNLSDIDTMQLKEIVDKIQEWKKEGFDVEEIEKKVKSIESLTTKNKNINTIDEFLFIKPLRNDYKWRINKNGFVELELTEKKIGLIKRNNTFKTQLDQMGSIVWEHCDGTNPIWFIISEIRNRFPDEKNIDQRLFLYLKKMKDGHYLIY